MLSYANLFHGIKKEGNKYVYVRAEELYKNYKAVDRFPLNKEMLDYLDRDILLNYSISMNLIETFSSIKVGSLLEYMQGVWYSVVLEKKNDSFIVMNIEASMIEKSFKTLEKYIIDRVKLGKLDRIETMYQRYTTKVIKQYDEHEVNLLVNKLKLLDLYKD